jgi:hypothetical protein
MFISAGGMKAAVHNVGENDGENDGDTGSIRSPRQPDAGDLGSTSGLRTLSAGDHIKNVADDGINVSMSQTMSQKKTGRRGKHKRNAVNYNPFAIRTVEEALPVIRTMARQYPELSVELRSWLSLYIAPEMTLDYYYGSYVTAMKIVAMMHASKDSIRDGIIPIVQALAAKIVEMVDAAHATRK